MENIISLRNIVVEFDGEKILKNLEYPFDPVI